MTTPSWDRFQFVAGTSRLYFTATNPESGVEIRTSDGTPQGTHLLADLGPGSETSEVYGSEVHGLVTAGDRLFAAVGPDLRTSDGTAAGLFCDDSRIREKPGASDSKFDIGKGIFFSKRMVPPCELFPSQL